MCDDRKTLGRLFFLSVTPVPPVKFNKERQLETNPYLALCATILVYNIYIFL